MAEYLVLAESIIFKNDKLTCINVYDNFRTVAMPSEFNFDLVVMCGPDWEVGKHNLSIKVKASNGKEINLGEASVNIPKKDFIYNAFMNDIKITMDYSVNDLTFIVADNGKEVISRKFPVIPMLVPQKVENKPAQKTEEKKAVKAEKPAKAEKKTTKKK